MAREYWLQRNGKTTGPFLDHQIVQMAAAGMIVEADRISADQTNWQTAGQVRGLFGGTQVADRGSNDNTAKAQELATADENGPSAAPASGPEAVKEGYGLGTKVAFGAIAVASLGLLVFALWAFALRDTSERDLRHELKPTGDAVVEVSKKPLPTGGPKPTGEAVAPAKDDARRATAPPAGIAPKKLVLDLDSQGMKLSLSLVPAGKFVMGSPKTEVDRSSNEGPQRQVTISKPFYMGITEVTQAQWMAVMGTEPWSRLSYKSGAHYPANDLSWDGSTSFCKALSKKTGKTVRLPTEAEWEYACRAGSTTRFCFGDDGSELGDYAWYKSNSRDKGEKYPHVVARKKPNAWGLHDMHGNLKEWCSDHFALTYANEKHVDPKGSTYGRAAGAPFGAQRVMRGGSWDGPSTDCRSARRFGFYPEYGTEAGFRVVVEVGGAKPPAPQAATTASAGTPPKELLSFWGFEIGSSYSACVGKMRELKQEGILSELSVVALRSGAKLVTGEGNVDRKGRLTYKPYSIELRFRNDALEAIELSYSFKSNYPRDLFDRQVVDMERFLRTKAVVWITEDDVGNRTRHATVDRGRIRAWIESVLDGDFKSFAPDIRIYSRQIKPSDLTKQQKLHLAYARENDQSRPPQERTQEREVPAKDDARRAAAPPAGATPKELVLDLDSKGAKLSLSLIPAGKFVMGSPETEKGRTSKEGPQREVTISRAFYMGVMEVTQGQYSAVMGKNLGKFSAGMRSVDQVSWNDAVEFCKTLSADTGRTVRLPTEAEWEYACRAGSKTRFSFGDADSKLGDHAWYKSTAFDKGEEYAHAVARKKPNAWGLYDMHGNAWEWCSDWYGESYADLKTTDPRGAGGGKYRVLRGGGWYADPEACRSAHRGRFMPDRRFIGYGFRVVVEVGEARPPATQVTTAPPAGIAPKKLVLDLDSKGVKLSLSLVPAGKFVMGSPRTEVDRSSNEGPQRKVAISRAFYMGVTEVTQSQWKAVMGTEPWRGQKCAQSGAGHAASYISRDDSTSFCKALSKKTGKTVRLPTEAEWEYACRAGSTTRFSFGDDDSKLGDYAWYGKNSGYVSEKYAHAVAQKKPNAWGLYDMHGNVYEHCADWSVDSYANAKSVDPKGPSSGKLIVLRGGCWGLDPQSCRSAFRGWGMPGSRYGSTGFRVVVEVGEEKRPAPQAVTSPPAETPPKKLVLNLDSKGAKVKMALIPAGKFMMGSPKTEKGHLSREGPQREVTISKAFYMGVTEVTQSQWKSVMGTEPWSGQRYAKPGADHAVSYVNWNDATSFCKALSRKTGKPVRLPTEAEWEYACRAGSRTRFSYGDDERYSKLGDYAWYKSNAWDKGEEYVHPVGRKKANTWGLYDMHGNVWEWCSDWYSDSYANAKPIDPKGPDTGTYRVLRGGSWGIIPSNCRSASRFRITPDYRFNDIGFRVVVSLD